MADTKDDTKPAPGTGANFPNPAPSESGGSSDEDRTASTSLEEHEPDQAKREEAAIKKYEEKIDNSKLTDDEKEILKLYNRGVHVFQIAKQVFKFANSETVGAVMLAIRKQHAPDFDPNLEDINSTRGYSGIGSS